MISRDKFLDVFEHYRDLPHQQEAVMLLYKQLPATVLADDAGWLAHYRSGPAEPAFFNPAGSEEAGMIGPKKGPVMTSADTYLLVNDRDEDMEAFDSTGHLLWRIPCLARGQSGDRVWNAPRSDTPPGLYKLGQVWDDRCSGTPAYSRERISYGWMTFDMVDLEGNEDNSGRAGICLHGGGSGCGWPGAWAPKQHLLPTYGCVRVHNSALSELIYPRYQLGTVYVGVWQEQ